jgi:hypothetical protein
MVISKNVSVAVAVVALTDDLNHYASLALLRPLDRLVAERVGEPARLLPGADPTKMFAVAAPAVREDFAGEVTAPAALLVGDSVLDGREDDEDKDGEDVDCGDPANALLLALLVPDVATEVLGRVVTRVVRNLS